MPKTTSRRTKTPPKKTQKKTVPKTKKTAAKKAQPKKETTSLIRLTMGDWSGDGHEKTTDVIISSNLTRGELIEAFIKGSEKSGLIDNRKTRISVADTAELPFCVEYEDNIIGPQYVTMLAKVGIDVKALGDVEDDGGVFMDWPGFRDVWLKVAQLGNPEFKYKHVELDSIHMGGYGLYL